jgi:hypothetical protein
VDDDEGYENAGEGEDSVCDEVHGLASSSGHAAEQRSKGAREQSREGAGQRATEAAIG